MGTQELGDPCPHCGAARAADRHRCPIDLEPGGCRCCPRCEQTCADLAWHKEALGAASFIDPGKGEVEITYWMGVSGPAGEEEPGHPRGEAGQ
ncbi:MAG TPA: hypothetical protein VFW71_06470 [Actinomycetota bacterium]|nr:hypothetical protein [Actinomycetota bacterium]